MWVNDHLWLLINIFVVSLIGTAVGVRSILQRRPVDPAKISKCPFCDILPRANLVGDRKQYFVMMCPNCKCTVRIGDGRGTVRGAVKVWNRRVKEYENERFI